MSHTPDDQVPKEAVECFMDREMEYCEPHSGTNPKREARTEEKVDDRERGKRERGQRALRAEKDHAAGSRDGTEKVKDATEEQTPVKQEEQGSYIQTEECR
jgi:hypothetical protein